MKRWSFLPLFTLSPWWWLPIASLLVGVDYLTGPFFQFPSVYILLVVVAAWTSGLTTALALSVVMPVSRVVLMLTLWNEPWDSTVFIATAATRFVVFSVMALVAARLADHERAMEHEVEVLTSLLPVCTYCRKIRRADDRWTSLEAYAQEATHEFSTGLCPECSSSHLPEYAPVTEEQTGGPRRVL